MSEDLTIGLEPDPRAIHGSAALLARLVACHGVPAPAPPPDPPAAPKPRRHHSAPPLMFAVTGPAILRLVAWFYDVPVLELQAKKRHTELARVRFVFYYLTRRHTRLSLLRIAMVTNADHTSVLHGERQCRALMATNDRLRDEIEVLNLYLEDMKSRRIPTDPPHPRGLPDEWIPAERRKKWGRR